GRVVLLLGTDEPDFSLGAIRPLRSVDTRTHVVDQNTLATGPVDAARLLADQGLEPLLHGRLAVAIRRAIVDQIERGLPAGSLESSLRDGLGVGHDGRG